MELRIRVQMIAHAMSLRVEPFVERERLFRRKWRIGLKIEGDGLFVAGFIDQTTTNPTAQDHQAEAGHRAGPPNQA